MAYPSSLQSLLGLVVSAKVSNSSLGAPVVTEDGSCVGLVMRRTAKKRRVMAGAGGEGGGGGGSGGAGAGAGRRRVRPSAGQLRGAQQEAQAVAVAVPVILCFLSDVSRRGAFQGLPSLSVQHKALVAAPLREALGMAAGQQGLLVLAVNPCAASAGVLRVGDVLMRVNGIQVNNEGKVAFR